MVMVRYEPTSGADNDALTTSNTPSSDIWSYNSVNGGIGTAQVETTVHSIPGASRIFHFAKTTSSGQNYGLFSETPASTYAFRLWFWFTALSSGTTQMVRFLTAANAAAINLSIMSTGKIKIQNPNLSVDLWYPNAGQTINCTTGVLYRLEGYVVNADTTGTLKARLIRDSDGATMASTTTLTGLDMAAADVGNVRIGAAVASNSLSIDWEGILDWEPGATDYLPDYSVEGPPTPDFATQVPMLFRSIDASTVYPTGTDTSVRVHSIDDPDYFEGVDADGNYGIYGPNATNTVDVELKGMPSGEVVASPTAVAFTEVEGGTVNVTAPRRWNGSTWT